MAEEAAETVERASGDRNASGLQIGLRRPRLALRGVGESSVTALQIVERVPWAPNLRLEVRHLVSSP